VKDRNALMGRKLLVPGVVVAAFWLLGAVLWRSSGYIEALLHFGYLGTTVGGGLGLYTALPKRHKPTARKFTLFLAGAYLLGFTGVLNGENIQIEGFFFSLLAGFFQAAFVHYLIAKIFGPLLFGRLWCGWACWTAMLLDLLPYGNGQGRRSGGWLRYLHFALSLGLVLGLWFGLDYALPEGSLALAWLIAGNAFYFLSAIALAAVLKDNRAFCKYVCPITVLLKLGTRFSLLKVAGDRQRCVDCGACAQACPMDIQIHRYVLTRRRVLSTECILCQTCVNACSRGVLRLKFGLDAGRDELLHERVS
jgi:ferredoxin-type protein NapH